jgi:hypothetical protein
MKWGGGEKRISQCQGVLCHRVLGLKEILQFFWLVDLGLNAFVLSYQPFGNGRAVDLSKRFLLGNTS